MNMKLLCILLIIGTGGLIFAQTNPNLTGYFVAVDGQPSGPHDTAGLWQLVNNRQLNRNTLVWKEGMSAWIAAGAVEEMAHLLSAIPPPLPSAAVPPPLHDQVMQETEQSAQHQQADRYRWYNSYAPGLRDNRVFLNLGVGLGPLSGYDMGIPPISASLDVKVSNTVPITVGGTVMFTTWKVGWWGDGSIFGVMNIGVGARAMYHFNFARNLDVYTGLTLGYVIQISDYIDGHSFFLWGGSAGVRYFFTDSIGVYSELGYSGLQILSVGLTMKF